MKKILALTSIRSDYDLMSSLFRLLADSSEIEFKLLVSGAHLSPTYGRSVDLIIQDGFDLLLTIETLIDSDSRQSRLKTASLLLQNAIDPVAAYAPDLLLLTGDREDVIMGALLGGYLEIPTLHFYGGDHVRDGHIDNPVRHATSKLVTAHLVSTDEHRQRLLRMGESMERIFRIGSIALDRFVTHTSMPRMELLRRLGVDDRIEAFSLLIFHPVDEERPYCDSIVRNILGALKAQKIHTFISSPNTDPGNRTILRVLKEVENDPLFHPFKNLDRETYLSLFKQSRFIIGNSSAGILESASVPLPAINVGLRQQGRSANANVLFCGTEEDEIRKAIRIAISKEFLASLKGMRNIYGDGDSARKALAIIESIEFSPLLRKREDPLSMHPEANTP